MPTPSWNWMLLLDSGQLRSQKYVLSLGGEGDCDSRGHHCLMSHALGNEIMGPSAADLAWNLQPSPGQG